MKKKVGALRANGAGSRCGTFAALSEATMHDISTVSFQDAHAWGWLLLVGLALFPRLTTLFIGGPFGLLQWLGWAIAPHFLVAIMATTHYWDTDPILCVVAWCFAFAGTGSEGKAAQHAQRRRRRGKPD